MTLGPQRACLPPALTTEEAEHLARRHGLKTLSERPPLRRYLTDLWQRRSFLWTLSTAESYARNEDNRLGQVWSVLNPALLIASYYAIFGLLLQVDRGISNFIGFIATGVVMFMFTSSVVTRGAKAITGNLSLVRALHFPRALLPISVTLTEFIAALPAFALLFALMLATGETPDWEWLLFPVAVTLQGVALLGVAFIAARLVNMSRDLANLIPIIVRLLRYVSGVFFPVVHYAQNLPQPYEDLVIFQPFALMLNLGRQSLLTGSGNEVVVNDWLMMAAWAVGLSVIGLLLFWWDEARYGRG